MRDRDRAEIYATRWDDDPVAFADVVANSGDFQWMASADGRPVAMIGATPRWKGVWSVWGFGTAQWPRVVRRLTKHVTGFMIPALHNSGYTRADCFALEEHADTRRWLTAMGAKQDFLLDKWGRNGETFVCYVWTRETTLRRARRIAPGRAHVLHR